MLRRSEKRKAKKPKRVPRRLRAELLEDRLLMHGGEVDRSLFFASSLLAADASAEVGSHFHADPLPEFNELVVAAGGSSSTPSGFVGATHPLSNLPALSSLPGAAATLYLGFLGHYDAVWGGYSNITTPVFDQDGDVTTFSDGELATIQGIWQAVAEDYAPFNVNVTTVLPPSFANGVAQFVAIGGNGAWTGGTYGGVAYVNSFTNGLQNVSFVFTANLANGNAKYTAEAVSHEAGHAFGLQHQSQYAANGALLNAYYAGPGDGTAPIMGNSYYATRGLWWNGTSTSSTTYQDDMTVIARAANGFGYRADDHGNTVNTATALVVSNNQFSSAGIISTTSDADYFSFNTGAGAISLTVNVLSSYNNLDARIELRDAVGTLIASASPTNSFNATINATVAAGSYRLVVASGGGYGNVGQYTVSGTVTTPGTYTLFSNAATPAIVDSGDGQAIELGVKIRSDVNGYITGLRFYKSTANTGVHTAHLWSSTGQLLASANFTGETASGWQQVNFAAPVAISAGVTYVASYHTTTGHYSVTRNYFGNAIDSGPLHALANGASGNGVYAYGTGGFPTQTYQSTNYWVDAVLSTTPGVNQAPTLAYPGAQTMYANTALAFGAAGGNALWVADADAGSSPLLLTLTATNGAFTLATTAGLSFTSGDGTADASMVFSGTAANINAALAGATFAPTNNFTGAASLQFTVDDQGNSGTGGAQTASGSVAITVDVAIQLPYSDDFNRADGSSMGSSWTERTGNHSLLGNRLFSTVAQDSLATVNALAVADVSVTSNVAIADGSAAGLVARYGANGDLYLGALGNSAGSYSAYIWRFKNGQWSMLAHGAASGAGALRFDVIGTTLSLSLNGALIISVQDTAITAAGTVGCRSWNVGAMYDNFSASAPAPDTTAPTVSAYSPAGGTSNVATSATASITFSEAMDSATINGGTVRLLDGATPVAASVAYNASTNTVTLTPSAALANSKTYTISVTGGASGVKDLAGNALAANATSTFTTAPVGATTYSLFNNSGTPAVIDGGDAKAVEVGVKFTSSTSGYITGIRFYKAAGNAGTHTAHLWSSTGQLLASANFAGETASGWQQVNFATPVAIAAGVTYVASYHTTSGHYSVTRNFFGAPMTSGPLTALANGGVYAYGTGGFPTQSYQSTNYWVDAVLSTV